MEIKYSLVSIFFSKVVFVAVLSSFNFQLFNLLLNSLNSLLQPRSCVQTIHAMCLLRAFTNDMLLIVLPKLNTFTTLTEQLFYIENVSPGLFTWRVEDPRKRTNFSFSLHAEISVGVFTKWRMKRGKIKLSAFSS